MLFQEINKYRYLFLDDIREVDTNVLKLYLRIGRESEQTEDRSLNGVTLHDVRPILEDEELRLEVAFSSYVSYNVRWETYTVWRDYDIFEGKTVREYSKSRYLEYVRSDTIASDEWPGKLRHFGLCCGWQVIDVVSVDEPVVRMFLAHKATHNEE